MEKDSGKHSVIQPMPCNSMEVIRAIEAEDEIINLKIQITKLKSEKQKLLEENERLRQKLRELSQMGN